MHCADEGAAPAADHAVTDFSAHEFLWVEWERGAAEARPGASVLVAHRECGKREAAGALPEKEAGGAPDGAPPAGKSGAGYFFSDSFFSDSLSAFNSVTTS